MTYGNAMPEGIAIESANENITNRAMLFEGDIMLTVDQRAIVDRGISSEIEEMRAAQTYNKWPRNKGDNIEVIVPYTIKTGFTDAEKALIAAGIDQFHKSTCIKFEKRMQQEDYIEIFKGDPGACWSYVGRIGGKQQLSLGEGCPDTGVVVHEIMHALGWLHEQSRADRDNHIKIHWDNIEEKYKYGFDKCENCDNQGQTYDTTSIMQYATWAFAKDQNKPSMTKIGCPDDEVWPSKESGCRLGQYNGLSESDIKEVNLLYCQDTGPVTEPPCGNEPDYANYCEHWAQQGFCIHSYVDFMKENCALACGCPVIDPVTEPPCGNEPDFANYCQYWAEQGFCQHSHVDFMKENCALACGCPNYMIFAIIHCYTSSIK